MNRFELLDHSGDLGLKIWASTPEAVFEQAARGLMSIITVSECRNPSLFQKMVINEDELDLLLVRWLQRILVLFETEGFVFCGCRTIQLKEGQLAATMKGEPFDATHHPILREVKAVTYHNLVFEQRESGWFASVIFDL